MAKEPGLTATFLDSSVFTSEGGGEVVGFFGGGAPVGGGDPFEVIRNRRILASPVSPVPAAPQLKLICKLTDLGCDQTSANNADPSVQIGS